MLRRLAYWWKPLLPPPDRSIVPNRTFYVAHWNGPAPRRLR